MQSYELEKKACGLVNNDHYTFLRAIGPTAWMQHTLNRQDVSGDGVRGENPIGLFQASPNFQVSFFLLFLKPSLAENIQELYLE